MAAMMGSLARPYPKRVPTGSVRFVAPQLAEAGSDPRLAALEPEVVEDHVEDFERAHQRRWGGAVVRAGMDVGT